VAERGVLPARVIEALDISKTAVRASCLVVHQGRRMISLRLCEAWNASQTALSTQSPIEPIDTGIPACAKRPVSSRAVSWAASPSEW
jgi:hypothetical protein